MSAVAPILGTPSPIELGAPKRYTEWRNGQDKLFWDILEPEPRFSIHCAPTGCGKSLAYMTALLAKGKRGIVITESKALQDQLRDDFGCVGLFDMRGLSNYTCRALDQGGHLEKMWVKRWGTPTCDVGPCTAGMRCDLKNGGCDYFDNYRAANAAQMVSTNGAYWIAINRYGQGLGKFDWMIIDECHTADTQLSSALSIELNDKDFTELGTKPPKHDAALSSWRMWGRVQHLKVQGKLEHFEQAAKLATVDENGMLMLVRDTDIPDASELKFWKRLEGKLAMLADSNDDWILQKDVKNGNITVAPVWVHKYAEKFLFRGIPRVIMLSATVTATKYPDFLGLQKGTWKFREYPSVFPVKNRPIYCVPTAKMSYPVSDESIRIWIDCIDQIISQRLDRKGIIHTVSYDRQKALMMNSRYRHLFMANMPGDTRKTVKRFREAKAPAILVSPSVGTGFDFPFDAARYQIVGKVPYKDARNSIMKVRCEDDPNYLRYVAAQDLIQLYGRTNRDPKDWSETFIVDDCIDSLIEYYPQFFQEYFLEAVQFVDAIPAPPSLEVFAAC